jgi:uncharacterized repeat protein (TIGR01451 family)
VDTLPSGVSYVAGSANFAGASIADPAVSGSTLTWSGLFTVPANSSADLTFQAAIPNVAGSYSNSAVAHVGSSQIDTTTDTSSNSPATVTVFVGTPVLAVSSTHGGNFTQGQTGATYTLTVSNTGSGPTSGTVTVTDTLPAGMTATAIGGTGWSCTLATLTCTRTDALAAGSSYPPITVTVNVASNAGASLTNSVTASGGGATNPASGTDVTSVTQLPVLAVSSTHGGNFTQGQTGATYTLTVSNTGSGPTSGTVTVTDTLPAGMTATAIGGSGWSCTLATLTCTRTDALAAGSSYPPITVTVNVASNAGASLTNSVTASGGGATNPASGTDVTSVNPKVAAPTTTTLALSPGNSVNAGTTVTLTATVLSSGTAVYPGVVEFCDATAVTCTGPALFATAQLMPSGSAMAKAVFGVGNYSIRAVFDATSNDLGSASGPQALAVNGTGGYTTTTTIAATGASGVYNLTGTVTAFGKPAPTGTVSFLDATNGNAAVGSAALDPATLGYTANAASKLASVSGLPYWLAAADFNNDGNIDVVVPAGDSNSVGILPGNGDGTFQAPSMFSTEPNTTAYAVAVGDFNADGNPDLVVTNIQGAPTVSVLLGNGDGTFQPQQSYAVGNNPAAVAVADINGDGNADIVVVNHDDGSVSVLLGNGDGTFQPQVTYPVGDAPIAVAITDLKGDGVADLLVANSIDNTISVLLGNGDGTFQSQVTYAVGKAPLALAVADLNGDGHVDVVVANRDDVTISVLLGNGDGTLQPQVTSAANTAPVSLALADLDGNGHIDAVVSNSTNNNVSVLFGNGDGTFQAPTAYGAGVSPYGVVTADFNGDGLTDIATVSNTSSGQVTVLLSERTESATATGVSLTPGSHDVFASYPGDADHEASQSNPIPLAGVPLIPTATALSGSASQVTTGQPVTFTATVTPIPTGSPLGSVSFFSGSTLLGTGGVSASGVATFTTSSLAAGSYSITATYSGNTAFAASTSSPVSVTVLNPAVYTVTASQTPYTAAAGHAISIPVNVLSVGGAYTAVVTMSASNLPPGSTVAFNPPTVVPGTSGATTMMTIQTTPQDARLQRDRERLIPFTPVCLAACLFVFAGRRKHLRASLACMLTFAMLGAGMLISTGCGGGFTGARKSATYVITITGTSGAVHPSTTVTLIVHN